MTVEVAARAFRDCVGEFATGVMVVIAEHDGEPAGMTLNLFTSVSLEPLLVLVSLGPRLPHDSRREREMLDLAGYMQLIVPPRLPALSR